MRRFMAPEPQRVAGQQLRLRHSSWCCLPPDVDSTDVPEA
jgi:hypothetical protein